MTPESEFFQRDRNLHPPALTPDYKTSVLRSPRMPLMSLQHVALRGDRPGVRPRRARPARQRPDPQLRQGRRADRRAHHRPRPRARRERPAACPNTLVEFWQANAGGRYRHKNDHYIAPIDPNFGGCGRTLTDENGYYAFRTIKPGPYPWRNRVNDWRPAHIHFSIFGSGLVQRLITQMYFEGDPLIRNCPILGTIPDPAAIQRPDRAAGPERVRAARQPRLPLRHRPARPRARRCSRTSCRGTEPWSQPLPYLQGDAVADRRPLCAYRPDPAAGRLRHLREQLRQRPGRPGDAGRAHPHRGPRLRRHRHAGAATSCSRSGRPTPPAATTIRPTGRTQAARRRLSRLGPHAAPTSRPASTRSTRSSRAGRRAGTAERWRRTSTSGSSRAASTSASTRASTSATRRGERQRPGANLIELAVRRETLLATPRGARRARPSTASTSACRASARPSSSTSEAGEGPVANLSRRRAT